MYEEADLTESELERIKSSHEQLLYFVEACSKIAQKSWIFDLEQTLRLARLQGRAEYMLQHVVEKNFMFDPHAYNTVSCDFQVKETRLAFDYDLMALKERVLQLFDWYDDDAIRTKYLAPYLPVIQSSGMGKTKLLYELRQHLNTTDRTIHVALILNSSGELEGDQKETYDEAVELEECMKREPDPELKYREVEKEMEHLCRLSGGKPTILLFDEAQNLLVGKDNHLFNCIQWWLCKKQKRPQKVVAVFAGTTLAFANIPRAPPESDDWGEYYMDGSHKYPPFFEFHTMGCLLTKIRVKRVHPHQAEYDESVGYGRPLFAKMGERGLLDEESQVDILRRLVLSNVNDWWRRVDACFSVLATRVQMGQTTINIAAQLVSRGYAILMDLDIAQQTADIAHLPDPVCARLAMCLMKEDWKTDIGGLSGRGREFWVNKMAEIFSEQTCNPSAGDEGEVFAALYMLFCGDILRFIPRQLPSDDENDKPIDMSKPDNQCKHFSVSLTKWIHLLISGGEEPASWDEVPDTIDASVCFIQVCQNYLRYQENMSCWTSQSFLGHLYKSRSAFYCFEDNAVFDIFASLRYQKNDPDEPEEYFPLLISIVCLPKFLPSEATSACCAMEMSLTKARCYGGLCILLVLGRTTKTEFDEDLLLTEQDLANIPDEIVSKVIEIPSNDTFNITNKFWGVTSYEEENAEIFASHSYIAWHEPEELISKDCLRAGKRQESNGEDGALQKLDAVRVAIGKGLHKEGGGGYFDFG